MTLAIVLALLPVVGLGSGFVGHWLARKSAREANDRGRRDELMNHMRWACGLAVSENPREAQMGVDQLEALEQSPLFTEADKVFIDAAMRSSLRGPMAAIEAGKGAGTEITVIQLSLDTGVSTGVDSPHEEEGGDDH